MKYSKIKNVIFEDVDHKDRPDYSDAFISSADYDGLEMSQEQIESIPDEWVHELLIDSF